MNPQLQPHCYSCTNTFSGKDLFTIEFTDDYQSPQSDPRRTRFGIGFPAQYPSFPLVTPFGLRIRVNPETSDKRHNHLQIAPAFLTACK
jgi:hypothetical protein